MNSIGLACSGVQQPVWEDHSVVGEVRAELAAQPGLVRFREVFRLRQLLASVVAGEAHVIQAGDCAEDPAEATRRHVTSKVGLLDALAGAMSISSRLPVIRVGRIAGQYAKPRSSNTELVDGVELPVFRGHMVNGPEATPEQRRPDPRRMLAGYHASRAVMTFLRAGVPGVGAPVWTSHEALLLDYEQPMVRELPDGRLMLTSTHWPWIGDRTRDPRGEHVALLASVANPVACKVGPSMTREALLDLCERLDPDRAPGRLTLIARLGADAVGTALPPLVAAVRAAGHPVIWMCDPMHGNTVSDSRGRKTRYVPAVAREVNGFCEAVAAAGGVTGGLHLETTPDSVAECRSHPDEEPIGAYTSLCDPRLNPRQAIEIAATWRGASTDLDLAS